MGSSVWVDASVWIAPPGSTGGRGLAKGRRTVSLPGSPRAFPGFRGATHAEARRSPCAAGRRADVAGMRVCVSYRTVEDWSDGGRAGLRLRNLEPEAERARAGETALQAGDRPPRPTPTLAAIAWGDRLPRPGHEAHGAWADVAPRAGSSAPSAGIMRRGPEDATLPAMDGAKLEELVGAILR